MFCKQCYGIFINTMFCNQWHGVFFIVHDRGSACVFIIIHHLPVVGSTRDLTWNKPHQFHFNYIVIIITIVS